jgi:hypothetical protein
MSRFKALSPKHLHSGEAICCEPDENSCAQPATGWYVFEFRSRASLQQIAEKL